MESSIVENIPTPWESIFKLVLTSKCPYKAEIQKNTEKTKLRKFPYFSISARDGAIPYLRDLDPRTVRQNPRLRSQWRQGQSLKFSDEGKV